MDNILELFYDLPGEKRYEQDSPFVKTAHVKVEIMEMLTASMTDRQKELLEAYFDADVKILAIIHFDRFRYAFHLGAQLMTELIDSKRNVMNK